MRELAPSIQHKMDKLEQQCQDLEHTLSSRISCDQWESTVADLGALKIALQLVDVFFLLDEATCLIEDKEYASAQARLEWVGKVLPMINADHQELGNLLRSWLMLATNRHETLSSRLRSASHSQGRGLRKENIRNTQVGDKQWKSSRKQR